MTEKPKTFAQDGYMPTPRIATQGKGAVQNGYLPTPPISTAQGQSQNQGSEGKK